MKVSVVVPVKNEAANLPRLLKSLSFADEVIVIDTGSTDDTINIAQEHGAKVVREDFENFAQIRNFGDQLARNDWILSLDADNQVPPELAAEITNLPTGAPRSRGSLPVAYRIGRVNYIFGKAIMHADWGPYDDCNVHLYHRSLGSWAGQVHEQFITETKPKRLKNFISHFNYSSIDEYLTKLNRYSDLEAARRKAGLQSFSYFRLFWEPIYDFGKRYFYKLGFLEGWHGLYLSILQAIYYLTVNIKLWPSLS